MINNCPVKGKLHSNQVNSLRKIFSPLGCIFPLMWTAIEMHGMNKMGLDFGNCFGRGKNPSCSRSLILRVISKTEKHCFIAKTNDKAGLVFTCLNVLTTFCIL